MARSPQRSVRLATTAPLEQQSRCHVNQRWDKFVLQARVLHFILLLLPKAALQAHTLALADVILALRALFAKAVQLNASRSF